MIPLFACWYYSRYLCPYVDGTLQARHPMLCRKLQGHLARCESCRANMRALEQTFLDIHAYARTARADDVHSVPARASWRRPPPLADRVAAQLLQIEGGLDMRRRKRIRIGLIFLVVAFFTVCVTVTQSTPARQWLRHNVLGQQLADPTTSSTASQRTVEIAEPMQYADQIQPIAISDAGSVPARKSDMQTAAAEPRPNSPRTTSSGKLDGNAVHHKGKASASHSVSERIDPK